MGRIKIDITGHPVASLVIKVRITDINYGNHVGNDAFVSLIHEARVQWLAQHHFTELNAAGTGLIMGDLAVEFKGESFYGDELTIDITAEQTSKLTFDLFYRLTAKRNSSGILIAHAKTGMVCYDYEKKKPALIPAGLLELLQPAS